MDAADAEPETRSIANTDRARDKFFWQPAAIIVAVTAVIVAGFQFSRLDGVIRNLATLSALGLAGVLLFGWFVALSGLNKYLRRAVLGLGLVGAALFWIFFRIEGPAGDFSRLYFTRRFAPKHDLGLVDETRALSESNAQRADLTTTSADDFPQFLGPSRDCVVHGVRLARDWTTQPPREVWRVPVGAGWSSFAIVGDYAVTQEQRGVDELVTCYELATGRLVWAHGDSTRYDSVVAGDGPRATPTIHQGKVYTQGSTGFLDCLDGATGKPIWSHDLVKEYNIVDAKGAPRLEWGRSGSPLIVDGMVILGVGGGKGNCVVAFDAETGDVVWHVGDDFVSYASPMLATLAGKRQLVMINETTVTGHDPATGEILWSYAWPPTDSKAAQPVVIDDHHILVAASYGMGAMLLEIESDDAGEFLVKPVWERFDLSLKPKFTNLALVDRIVYGLDEGVMCAFDVDSKKRTWKRGRYGHGQLLAIGDLLLVTTEGGEVVLVEASADEHRELGRLQALSDKTWNNPALSGARLLVRNHKEAACYELPLAPTVAAHRTSVATP